MVLVQPQYPGNVGSAARALHNSGLARLVVVDPHGFDPMRVRWMAPGCEPILEGLRIVRSGLAKDDRIVVSGLQRVRPGSPIDPQDTPMASPETLAALQQQRQALEASNQPQAQKKLDAKVAAAASPRG